jgi:hypothetical protein
LCGSQPIKKKKKRKYNGRQPLKFIVAFPPHSEKYLSSLIKLTMLVSPSSVIISSFHIRRYPMGDKRGGHIRKLLMVHKFLLDRRYLHII